MAEGDELDLVDSADQEEEKNKAEKRIKSLSEKVKLTAEERDNLAKAKEESDAKAAEALKDAEFYKNFTTTATKYPGAADYLDKIQEKHRAGYSVEDATISTLVAEGKFTPPTPPPQPKESPAGGSAVTNVSKGEKSVSEMSQEERRKVLEDNLSLTL